MKKAGRPAARKGAGQEREEFRMERKISHEEMMGKAWRFIADMEITENREELTDTGYLVKNVYQVRDAYYADLESGHDFEGEEITDFFARHNIEWD